MTTTDKQVAALREAAQFALDWLISDTKLTPKDAGARFQEVKSRLRGALAAHPPTPVTAPGDAEREATIAAWRRRMCDFIVLDVNSNSTAVDVATEMSGMVEEALALMRQAPPAPASDQALTVHKWKNSQGDTWCGFATSQRTHASFYWRNVTCKECNDACYTRRIESAKPSPGEGDAS